MIHAVMGDRLFTFLDQSCTIQLASQWLVNMEQSNRLQTSPVGKISFLLCKFLHFSKDIPKAQLVPCWHVP